MLFEEVTSSAVEFEAGSSSELAVRAAILPIPNAGQSGFTIWPCRTAVQKSAVHEGRV